MHAHFHKCVHALAWKARYTTPQLSLRAAHLHKDHSLKGSGLHLQLAVPRSLQSLLPCNMKAEQEHKRDMRCECSKLVR